MALNWHRRTARERMRRQGTEAAKGPGRVDYAALGISRPPPRRQPSKADLREEGERAVDEWQRRQAEAAEASDDLSAAALADEAVREVTDVARKLGCEDQVSRELAPLDELVDTAEAYGRAVRAAASCRLRKGGS